MREIKFRGKRIDSDMWLYGFYHTWETLESPSSNRMKTIYHIYTKNFDLEVEEKTIGQYTGLQDRNGREIFEGDIIRARINHNYYVCKFEECSLVVEDKWGSRIKMWQGAFDRFECEVIGNIYDNPELLEEGGNE